MRLARAVERPWRFGYDLDMGEARRTRKPSRSKTYAASGVSLIAADEMEDRIGPLVRRTYGPRVLADHGGFAGAFRLDFGEKLFRRNYVDPVLLSCTDGVGSKVLVAARARRYDTVGIDLVAMSVNDLLCAGAEPLFFLDYIALHRLDPAVVQQLVAGVVAGCEQSECALLGGETAEMPDLYRPGTFDLAGFAVGVVERSRMMSPRRVRVGDELVGVSSSGLHSNGYALVRRLLLDEARLTLDAAPRSLGEPLVDALLRPTRIYARAVKAVLGRYRGRSAISGMAHITGGGLEGNLPRILPPGCRCVVRQGSWPIPPIFGLLARHGVADDELYRVFNMGVGYVFAVRPRSAAAVVRTLERAGECAFTLGRVIRGEPGVEFR